jgi:hypothetical protein
VTPYRVCFIDDDCESVFYYFDFVIDILFLIDLVLNFFSAYIDSDENVIRNHKSIVINYLTSWFAVDILSLVPINLITDGFNCSTTTKLNKLAKVIRIPRLYKLFKLTRLFRMLKIMRGSKIGKITKFILDKFKVDRNIERFIIFIFLFLILNHLSACFWFLIAKFDDFSPETWVSRLGYNDESLYDLYLLSFYFTLTTVTTVGYGDINAGTSAERFYNLIIMSIGVVMYSFAIGSLTSIVAGIDAKNAKINSRLQTLHSIRYDFKISQDIYDKVRKIIKHDLTQDQNRQLKFLQVLPHKLRIELSQIIHENMIKKLYFFKDKPFEFLGFVAPLLKPIKFLQNEFLYKILETMDESKLYLYRSSVFYNKRLC